MKYQTLVFDLDGTLVDPLQGILRCMNHALTSFDYKPITVAQIKPHIGPPPTGGNSSGLIRQR